MSAQVATQTQSRGTGQRGRRGGRGRGGNRGRGGKVSQAAAKGTKETSPEAEKVQDNEKEEVKQTAEIAQEDDSAVCWICAEPVKYYSVSECNHRTCHVCALRLRALYKKLECTFCKEPQQSVIFTTSPDASWSSYAPDAIPHKDVKLSIYFETQEMMEESLILLRFNCSDSSCDYIANGWSDLKLHTRGIHGKVLCDLCIRFKKIFAHEHILYSPNHLPYHLPSMQRGHRAPPKEPVEGGIHPLCEFCRECFFSDDEIYAHMRENHEECFVCKRNEVRDQYFRNYDALEQHFTQAHFPCTQPVCLARKFVVFGSALDLKAHMVEEHGADMSARDKKDARRIEAEFEFEEIGVGGRRGRRDRNEREREPPPTGPPRANAAGARRREAFGGNLTANGGSPPTPNAGSSRVQSRRQSPSPTDMDPATAERHAALLARVSSIASNPNNAVPAVKAALRSYRSNESTARDLISTVWNITDRSLEGTAGMVNSIIDFLDEEEKKKDLLQAWNGFKIEQRNQFPELVPSGLGSEWAGITGGRLLNAKQSTASRSAAQSSQQVFNRVARAAGSSAGPSTTPAPRAAPSSSSVASNFPPLQTVSAAGQNTSGFRQPPYRTPWASSSTTTPSAAVIRGPTSVPGPGARTKPAPPKLSRDAFPELPTTATPKVPRNAVSGNQSLRNILGDVTPTTVAWRPGGSTGEEGSSSTAVTATSGTEGPDAGGGGGGKGKKNKGKQKQTLFTLGSFPA